MTVKFKNVYISDTYTVAGLYEKNGPISDYFDLIYDKDFYYGCDTFEKAEEKMLRDCIENLIDESKLKDSDIDYVISGDLQNQITSSCYTAEYVNRPFLGIYSACASNVEGLIIAANMIESKSVNNSIRKTI